MFIFTWGILGLAGVLLLASGLAWVVYLVHEDSDWRRLAVRLFRYAMVLVLFWINGLIYTHLVGGLID